MVIILQLSRGAVLLVASVLPGITGRIVLERQVIDWLRNKKELLR